MTVFEPNEIDELTNVINFFKALDEKQKVSIVSNVRPDNPVINQPEITQLLNMIANKIGKHVGLSISNELMKLGLDETYATLLVTNMKKHYPQLDSLLLDINNMSDEKFIDILPKITHILLDSVQHNAD